MESLKVSLISLFVLIGIWAVPVHAEEQIPEVFLSIPNAVYHVDETIPVTIKLSTNGLNLNAIDLTLNYSTVGLSVDRVERSLTNFPLWPDEPTWDDTRGTLHMSGGRPNGFISAGATVATVYVKLHASGLWQLRVGSISRGYENDGLGTPTVIQSSPLDMPVVELSLPGIELTSASHPSTTTWYADANVQMSWVTVPGSQYSFAFSSDPATEPDDVPDVTTGTQDYANVGDGAWWFTIKTRGADGIWSPITRRAALVDVTAPDPFVLSLLPSSAVGGQESLGWSTVDGGSGIAQYVLSVGGRQVGAARSPLTIRPEWQGKVITIRAFDEAGNSTSASWREPHRRYPWLEVLLAVGLIGGAGVASIFVVRKRQRR